MGKRVVVAVSLVVLGGGASAAWACNTGTVRDAAFQNKRGIHRLCLFAHANDPSADETFKRLQTWVDAEGRDVNIALERVNADDPAIEWEKYAIPSAPPSLPVVALIGEFPSPRRMFVIDYWEPGPTDADLAVLLNSPARDRIMETVVKSWAVILYSPDPEREDGATQSVLDAVAKRWAVDQPPGVTIVRIDRTDPRERTLRAFAGIERSEPDWVGVVFGRGKLMAPPLRGDRITEANLNELLEGLAVPCTCLQESITLGLDIPMKWDSKLDAMIASAGPPQGYVETTLDDQIGALQAQVPDEDRHVLASVVIPLGAAACVALAVVAFTVWRSRRRNAIFREG